MVHKSLSEISRFEPHYYEGIEIGAVSVKWVRRTREGRMIHEILRHEGTPKDKVDKIFDRYSVDENSKIVITGQATSSFLDLPYVSEIECLEKALSFKELKPDILLSLGGETFSVYPMKNGIIKNIISTSKCAAGTGEFIVQQLQRMGLSIEEGIKASKKGTFTQLATRCSVHCKSDATHKLNKGECNREDIVKTLIYDLAKKVSEMINSAQWPKDVIVVSGGVALNKVFVKNLQVFLPNSEIKVLPESSYLEVFGASLFASEFMDNTNIKQKWSKSSVYNFKTQLPLRSAEYLLDYRVNNDKKNIIEEGGKYILGVDAGSTTTKAVLYNISNYTVGAAIYLRTLGNPILATKQCLQALIEELGEKKINLIQCGVTGSAREMVSVYLDNCRSYNEILAHARAATQENPEVDTVFEIGGQDSKFISFLDKVPIDYAMNEGCSAGTGSFLEESASVDMGFKVEEISDIALRSAHPIEFGERCAAFINTDLRNALQQGANPNDVVAGLVYSIADNYISRIVGPRHIGDTLLFLGGVALNKSVALAIAARSQRNVIVPPHPELMGAVGTALMTRDLLENKLISEENHNLKNLLKGDIEIKNTFRCKSCENNCEIQRISIRGKVYPFGGLCSKYKLLRQEGPKIKEGYNLVDIRNKMMMEEFGPITLKNPKGTIGIPMALTSHSLFPLYSKYISELGYNVVISTPLNDGNNKTIAPICYPCELLHGAVNELFNRNVDYILIPHVVELEMPKGYIHGYTCPSTATIPDIIRAGFEKSSNKILSPHIGTSKDLFDTTLKEFGKIATHIGLDKEDGINAGKKAFIHYKEFKDKYYKIGRKKLEEIIDQPSVIIAGRPYVVYPPDINIALPRKIVSRGYNVIPSDLLPILKDQEINRRNVWGFTQILSNAVEYAKRHPNLYICFISCFSCGPDGTMYHHYRQKLAGKTFCYLEIDSHTAHAGFETRVGAFLDIIEERNHKIRKEEPNLLIPYIEG